MKKKTEPYACKERRKYAALRYLFPPSCPSPLRLSPLSVCPSRARLAHCLPVHVTLSSALASEPARRGQRQDQLHAPPEQTAVPRTCAHQAPEKVLRQHTKKKARKTESISACGRRPPTAITTHGRASGTRQRRRQQTRIRPRQRSSSCLRMRVSSSIRPCHPQAREVHVFYKATTMSWRERTGHEHGRGRGCIFWLYFALKVDVKRDGTFDLSQFLGPALLQNLARNLPCMRASGCERVRERESESMRLDGCSRATGSEHGRIVKRACAGGPT
jgi:hypothetical protein